MFYLRPQAGLANRMRAINSAVQLARQLQQQLIIHWYRMPMMNCRFIDLFNIPDNIIVKDYKSIINDYGRIESFFLPLSKLEKKIRFGKNIFLDDRKIKFFNKQKFNISSELNKYHNIYIQTCSVIKSKNVSNNILTPIESIAKTISVNKSHYFSENTIGVHIRRGDNIQAREKSPTELFIKKMNELIKENNNTTFFLATDSNVEEKTLKLEFPDRIITTTKELTRKTTRGIQDALIDLWLLSETKMILGSCYSSFSEVAAQVGGIPLIILTNN